MKQSLHLGDRVVEKDTGYEGILVARLASPDRSKQIWTISRSGDYRGERFVDVKAESIRKVSGLTIRRPKAYLYRDKRGEWRWLIVASNGRKLANGGESYKRRIDCLRMLERAMDGFGVSHYEERRP